MRARAGSWKEALSKGPLSQKGLSEFGRQKEIGLIAGCIIHPSCKDMCSATDLAPGFHLHLPFLAIEQRKIILLELKSHMA